MIRTGLLVALALLPGAAGAQDTVPAVPPPAAVLPIPPLEGAPGPLPRGSRWIFTRDSLVWSSAYNVAELLAAIPGVYVARTGFVTGAAALGVGGRGGDGIEVYWDGLPYQAVGPDSLVPDLSAISLFALRRVEVHQLPGRLRVYLVSERHERAGSRSAVRIVSGALDAGGYAGLYQHRWTNGLGLSLAADALRADRAPGTAGVDRAFAVWARLDWTPTARVAATWQFRRAERERDSLSGEVDVAARDGRRSDAQLQVRASTRPDGRGWSVAASLASSLVTDSSLADRVAREALVELGGRGTWSQLTLRAGLGDGPARRRLAIEGGVAPLALLVLHGGARWVRDAGGRGVTRVFGTASLGAGPVAVIGEAVRQADSLQRATDLALRVAWDTRWLAARVGIERRDPWVPAPIAVLGGLVPDPAPAGDWLIAWARLGPLRGLSASGWYAAPRGTTRADFQPPGHLRASLTYRSKFWPTFRSGAFDLKIEWTIERWDDAPLGRGAGGTVLTLESQTFQEWLVQFEIAHFRAFWNLRNAGNLDAGYLPGLQQPRNGQTFGVKWEFAS